MAKIEHKGIEFRSREEIWFYEWLREGEKVGLFSGIEYETETYQLTPKQTFEYTVKTSRGEKVKTKSLLPIMVYTPDFKFNISDVFFNRKDVDNFLFIESNVKIECLNSSIDCYNKEVIVDVKGTFGGQNNSSFATFPVKQKILFDKYNIFVNKVVPEKLFAKTWCPEYCFWTPTDKKCKQSWLKNMIRIKEFLNGK